MKQQQLRNYQKELDRRLEAIKKHGLRPHLLLHSCCAPCSSYCLEYLTQYFQITVFYYNPNITDETEYKKRVQEQQRLIREMCPDSDITFLEGAYDPAAFYRIARGLEEVPEGGERCFRCYRLRLAEAARTAAALGADYVTTTLSISPLKNAQKLNEIGEEEANAAGLPYLHSDFKKKNGYQRSIQLSKEYDLYRQNYCGCVYSKREAEKREADKRDAMRS